jgi:hypothetical protein
MGSPHGAQLGSDPGAATVIGEPGTARL